MPEPIKSTETIRPKHGVGWVLARAAAIGVLLVVAGLLMEFFFHLVAEQRLARAAEAGALEATLPRASRQSVEKTIQCRLVDFSSIGAQAQVWLLHNNRSVQGHYQAREGDRFSVQITVPTKAALPRLLRAFSVWPGNAPIVVQAERRMPGAFIGLE